MFNVNMVVTKEVSCCLTQVDTNVKFVVVTNVIFCNVLEGVYTW